MQAHGRKKGAQARGAGSVNPTAAASSRPKIDARPTLHATNALLRSLVVAPSASGSGVGSALVEHAENYVRTLGVRAMYLLTMIAEGFFARRGYQRIARGSVVPEMQATSEFTLLCPDNSVPMVKAL
jgi:N-acetylglutamate synthase-like GNAT family acetyltransferase